MERFVRDFNGAVIRAEAGIKALRNAARESGDDLEKLVEKAVMVRDELNYIVESADSVAERLSVSASKAMQSDPVAAPKNAAAPEKRASSPATKPDVPGTAPLGSETGTPPSSRAEKELLQALQKLSSGGKP